MSWEQKKFIHYLYRNVCILWLSLLVGVDRWFKQLTNWAYEEREFEI